MIKRLWPACSMHIEYPRWTTWRLTHVAIVRATPIRDSYHQPRLSVCHQPSARACPQPIPMSHTRTFAQFYSHLAFRSPFAHVKVEAMRSTVQAAFYDVLTDLRQQGILTQDSRLVLETVDDYMVRRSISSDTLSHMCHLCPCAMKAFHHMLSAHCCPPQHCNEVAVAHQLVANDSKLLDQLRACAPPK